MLYRIRQNNLYGFINETGTVLLPPEYNLVGEVRYGACVVVKNEKFGLVSEEGTWLLKPAYASLGILSKDRLCLKENHWNALADFEGNLLSAFEYHGIFDFSEGLAAAYKGLKFGFLNEAGKEIIPFEFEFAGAFEQGYAMVQQGKKRGLINKQGLFENPPTYDFYYSYENCYVVNVGGTVFDDDVSGGKFGLLSKDNKPLTALDFDFIGPFLRGEAAAKKDGFYGTIDDKGRITAPVNSTEIIKAKEEFNRILENQKHGLLKNETEEIIPAIYEALVVYPESWLCWAKKDGLFGILNFENIFVVPPVFDLNTIYPIQNGHTHIELKNGKHGLLSVTSGEWILPPEYDSIGVFKGSLVELKRDGKSAYANREGTIVWKE